MNETARERWRDVIAAQGSLAFQIELLRAFLRDYPDNAGAWFMFGIALGAVSRFAEAEDALRRAMVTYPERQLHLIYCTMGRLHQNRGDDATAEQWYRKAIEHSPMHTQGYIYLGALLARRGRLAEAEGIHRRGSTCDAGCIAEAHYNLGLVLRAQGRYAEAMECFERALTIKPQYKEARLAKRDVARAMNVIAE